MRFSLSFSFSHHLWHQDVAKNKEIAFLLVLTTYFLPLTPRFYAQILSISLRSIICTIWANQHSGVHQHFEVQVPVILSVSLCFIVFIVKKSFNSSFSHVIFALSGVKICKSDQKTQHFLHLLIFCLQDIAERPQHCWLV